MTNSRESDEELLRAMKMLQELRDSGEFCCLEIKSDYNYVWDVIYVHETYQNERGHIRRFAGNGAHGKLVTGVQHLYDAWKSGTLDDLQERPVGEPPSKQ